MIHRSFDGALLNELANHPDIRPDVGGDGESFLDLAPHVAEHRNYFLSGDHGGFFGHWTAPETFEIHTFIRPEGRGQWAFEFAREGREYMASQGAAHLWTRVAETARHTRLFTLKSGFKPCGSQILDLGGGPVLYHLFNWRS